METPFPVSEPDRIIRIIASLSSPRQVVHPDLVFADAIEIRLDLITEPIGDLLADLRIRFTGPIILTVRSSDEGGAFAGDSAGYREQVTPFLPVATYIDLESKFRDLAPWVRENGAEVIASCHLNTMPSDRDLTYLTSDLRSFGDIPKIAVQPQNQEDLLRLLDFTCREQKPIIVSVTGERCRYARPLLALFGSLFTYCYVDSPTSPGQYSIREMQLLSRLLTPGTIDTWFEGRPVRSGGTGSFTRRINI